LDLTVFFKRLIEGQKNMKRLMVLGAITVLALILISCSQNKAKDYDKMVYKVKKVDFPIILDGNWNSLNWEHANILELKNYMGDKPNHFPRTQAKLLYDDENLYVFFKVEDNYIRSTLDKLHSAVCQDSCVEFFFTPDYTASKDNYFNLEVNCGGTMLFSYNDKKNNIRKYVEAADCTKVEIYHSMPSVIAGEIVKPTTWTLSYKLPFDMIAKYSEMTKPQPGVKWRANFYKCADKTSQPHWLTWSYVDYPDPNFHLPQYFGVLEFE
jgi:hypothetical protein